MIANSYKAQPYNSLDAQQIFYAKNISLFVALERT